MKRRKSKIDKGKEARRAARNSGLAPAVTRVIPDKRKRLAKHKKQLVDAEVDG
jgi:molybdopterin biosynthesis enzyme MoaB